MMDREPIVNHMVMVDLLTMKVNCSLLSQLEPRIEVDSYKKREHPFLSAYYTRRASHLH